MNEVTTQEPTGQVVTYSVTTAEIEKLAEEYNEVPTDLTVKANYELCRKATATIRGLRGDVEKRRKELKADALAWGKKVDGEAKAITGRLLEIEEPFATAKKEFDTAVEIAKREAVLAEERRVDGIADRIAGIKALVEANISSSSVYIQGVIQGTLNAQLPCEEWAQEFSEKANLVIRETKEKLDELFTMKFQQESAVAQQAAIDAQRKADEEQRRRDEDLARAARDAEIEAERVKIAAERAEMEAKQAAIDAERKKEQEEMAAQLAALDAERAKVKADEEERVRVAEAAAIKREADEAKRQAEDQAAINKIQEEEDKQKVAEPQTPQATGATLDEQRNAAGKEMIKFIGNKQVVKDLLDAILNTEIPYIKFYAGE